MEFAKEKADDHILADDDTQHYHQLLSMGQHLKNNYLSRVSMRFFINKDARICILENKTEIEITDHLIERRVPKSDIIPAFLPANARQSAYAV